MRLDLISEVLIVLLVCFKAPLSSCRETAISVKCGTVKCGTDRTILLPVDHSVPN